MFWNGGRLKGYKAESRDSDRRPGRGSGMIKGWVPFSFSKTTDLRVNSPIPGLIGVDSAWFSLYCAALLPLRLVQ